MAVDVMRAGSAAVRAGRPGRPPAPAISEVLSPGTDFRQARFAGHVHARPTAEASELVASLFQPGSRQRVVADEEQRLQAWGVDGAPLNLAWRKACRANWKRT